MLYLRRTIAWTVAALIGFLALTAHRESEADPITDFSFSIPGAVVSHRYLSMTEERLAELLASQLDTRPSRTGARALSRTLIRLCQRHRFDPALILSLIHVESHFRTKVVSSAGAIGLMQIMPDTARFIAKRARIRYLGAASLSDPATNLTLGIAYLAYLRDKYEGRPAYFYIAAYNVGPARLDELAARKSFKPVKTLEYYEKIKRGVPGWRYYGLADRRA